MTGSAVGRRGFRPRTANTGGGARRGSPGVAAAWLLGALLFVSASHAAVAQRPDPADSTRPSLRAGTHAEEIHLDGLLTEAAWQRADSIASLTEIEPFEGTAPAARTVVRVLASPDMLVIGIRCDVADSAGIVSYARERDSDLNSEDHVRVVLDPFLTGRAGYVFAVNAIGARYDALISDQGSGRGGGRENANWDTIWEAATARTPTGWSVEIRIPVKSLLFRTGLSRWGFNVQRRVQRQLETQRWANPVRDFRITQTSRAGYLTDLPDFNLDRGLTVRPSAVAGAGVPSPDARLTQTRQLSFDATQRIGANTLASLTLNTDFAETEVDQRRTNLTRFDLFYPEKRTFFLEGADIFDFGPGIGQDVLPFWSRRLGLFDDVAVPIDAGTKETGRIGGTSFGLLAVRTRAVAGLLPATTSGVVRVKQNLFGESSIGFIGTAGDPTGAGGSWLAGGDVILQTSHFQGSKNVQLGLWGLTMDRAGVAGSRNAGGITLAYPNDLWNNSLSYRWIGDAFQPALGFVPRPGVQSLSLNINYSPRPSSPLLRSWLSQEFVEFRPSVVTDLSGRWESYRIFFAPINVRFQSGDGFEFNANPTGERLDAPFEIAPGDTIPVGSYRFIRYRLEGVLAAKRPVSGQFTWWFGTFYNGRLDQYVGRLSLKPSPLIIVELSGERDAGFVTVQGAHVPFTKDTYGARFRVNVSPDLQFNTFVQYDNESHSLGSNTRIRWTFSPPGELFLVYNHNIDVDLPDRRWRFNSDELSLKVQYAFRY